MEKLKTGLAGIMLAAIVFAGMTADTCFPAFVISLCAVACSFGSLAVMERYA